jgi:hypothetical protein
MMRYSSHQPAKDRLKLQISQDHLVKSPRSLFYYPALPAHQRVLQSLPLCPTQHGEMLQEIPLAQLSLQNTASNPIAPNRQRK